MRLVMALSGGMDSGTLAHQLLVEGNEVHFLTVNYGQRHRKELDYAISLVDWFRREPFKERVGTVADVALMGSKSLFKGSSQTDDNVAVPHGKYDEEGMKTTVVPNRNMLILSLCAARAISLGCHAVVYGAHAGDHAIYPDCRRSFVKAMETALLLCDWKEIGLLAPFLSYSKGMIAEVGKRLGTPYDRTWTCYEGGEKPCRKCGSCNERAEAFGYAGMRDPLLEC